MGSLYTALTNIREAIKPNDPDGAFLFLKLFTVSDGTLPSLLCLSVFRAIVRNFIRVRCH